MRIGLDIDGTITAYPEYFSELSQKIYDDGGSVIVITSRVDIGYNRMLTSDELKGLSIRYDYLHLFQPVDDINDLCPHKELDWYQQYLWQKVHHAINEKLDVYYEDEDRVLELFRGYAPELKVFDSRSL